MSKQIQSFNPSVNLTTSVIDTKGVNKGEQLVLFNDSVFGLLLTFPDGSIDILPACWCRDFVIKSTPMGLVQWSILNQLVPAANYPIIQVYGVLYEPGEHIAPVNASMQRGMTITGGTGVLANSVVNDGNLLTPRNVFIESTPSGVGQSTVSIATDGSMTIKGDVAGVLTTLLQLVPAAPNGTSSVILGDAARFVEILGKMLVDSNIVHPNAVTEQ